MANLKNNMRFLTLLLILFFTFNSAVIAAECSPDAKCSHAISMWDVPKYSKDFNHFEYTNPDAPKGGDVKMAAIGTFDSLNGNILKGVPASGLAMISDSLIISSDDEPFTKYGLLAHTIELANDNSWVAYHLRPEAKWHDGEPLTADDVVYSFNIIMEKGHPFYRSYFAEVTKVEAVDTHKVKFTFETGKNRELPLILGQLPILPKHYYERDDVDFAKTTLDAPLGSGPYKISKTDAGKSITYTRVKDYWGADLPVNKGRYNFDSITYDYYRDATVAIEAFKAGEYDMRVENVSKLWAEAYKGPALEDGKIIKMERQHERPTGMQAFVFNLRNDKFKDINIRKALSYAFDFEWANANLFHNAYHRTTSYFSNSEFASSGLPSEAELEILEPFKNQLPESVFTEEFTVPTTNGTGNNRKNLLEAIDILKQTSEKPCRGECWRFKNGKMVKTLLGPDGKTTGEEDMKIEFLLASPLFERVVSPIIRNLKRLGVTASMRTVDNAQYINRLEQFDFDIIVHSFGQSLSPGNEQMDYWHSSRANTPGARNVAGINNPVIDAIIPKIINAKDKAEITTAVHALDRVLLNNHYVIPQYHVRNHRIAYWNKFGFPETPPKYLVGFDTWWVDADKTK